MFARSTTWRQGEGRTWQNATSIKKTFPSRASRLEGLTSRWAMPAVHSLRMMDRASRIVARLTSASRISFPGEELGHQQVLPLGGELDEPAGGGGRNAHVGHQPHRLSPSIDCGPRGAGVSGERHDALIRGHQYL